MDSLSERGAASLGEDSRQFGISGAFSGVVGGVTREMWNNLAPQTRDYFEILLVEMPALHLKKAAGYGQKTDTWANFREAADLGVSPAKGVLVRMGDKWSRIKNLTRDPANEQLGEPLERELIDLASYAIIDVAIMREAARNG